MSDTEPSPYTPGSLPEYLAGRGRERDAIRTCAGRLGMLGRSGGPLLAFLAPRGLGKTSLLRIAQRDAAAEGYLTAWVTGRDDQPMLPTLARTLGAALKDKRLGSRAKDLLRYLDHVDVELGIPGAKIGVQGRPRDASPAHESIEELLGRVGKFARDHEHHGLVVFVDEFQEAQLGDRKSLLIALQHFDADPDGCPVAVVAAGLPSLPTAVTDAATFGERSRFVELGLLRDVAIAEALRVPAEERGVGWADDAVEAAIAVTAGYPHKVQLLGQAAWEAARPHRGDTIRLGHVHQGRDDVDDQMRGLYRSRWARATPEQRRFLLAMAATGGDVAARSRIADRMGVSSASLSRVRQELIDRGFVEPAGHGMLRFTIPGFDTFLRDAN